MKKISFLISTVVLLSVLILSVNAACVGGCTYTTSPWCDVCGEQFSGGECTGSHIYESGYCIVCGKADYDSGAVCPLTGLVHTGDYCADCEWGTPPCSHSDLGGLQIIEDSSCKKEGSGFRICLDCGASINEFIPKSDHVWRDGVCINCGADSFGVCSHKLSDWMDDENNSTMCGDEYWIFRECSLCGFKEWKGSINSHLFVNGKCEVCGALDSSHNHLAYRVVILNENQHMYLCACDEPYSPAESHFWEEQNRTSSAANHLPMTKTVVCLDCGFERVQIFVNPVLNTHTLINGERLTYSALSSYDCLFYEYTSNNAGSCEISVVNGAGAATKITLPTLSKGEKLLIDAKTGFYSIWSDGVSSEKIRVSSDKVWSVAGKYYNFSAEGYQIPTLDKGVAYFESAYLEKYNYPAVDRTLSGKGFDYLHPYVVNGSGVNVQLRAFPHSTEVDLKSDLDNYPLYLVLYDGANVDIKSVTSSSDSFIASYVALKGSNGGTNGGHITGGDSYSQGYADAYNTLTNAVIADNPIQGFMQGMWYGVLAMVTILGNGISIGGISLFSVLVTVLILCAGYLLLKVIRK